MAKHSIERRMGYRARQLFDIAADVDNYRRFVPLVKESPPMLLKRTMMAPAPSPANSSSAIRSSASMKASSAGS